MGGSATMATSAPIFRPDPSEIAGSQLTAFMRFCEREIGTTFADYDSFSAFAVADYRRFWALLLEWSCLIREGSSEPVCTDDLCERATFFPGLRLSYSENLLGALDQGEALVAYHGARAPDRLSGTELRDRVAGVAAGLRSLGLEKGDHVAAVSRNNAELVIAALAVASIGGVFSSAAPDIGVRALHSRFEQVAPKLLLASLADDDQTGPGAVSEHVGELAGGLPSLRALVALDDGPAPYGVALKLERMSDLIASPAEPQWPRFPFNHPLFVLFTSGTTGRPKCVVHGTGGTLIEHLKEHRLHVDLGSRDTLFFHTSAAWMMWNWQLSALACGAKVVLYDGAVAGPETLWRLVADERVTVFGTSPPYLQLCQNRGFSPRRELDLSMLRSVLSTGSILHDWQYDWVGDAVGPVRTQSISGGTDIIGCFVLGNPNLPIHRGKIQCRSLALDVAALREDGAPATSGVGELVCRNPFPSRPLGFLGDDGERFHASYFEQNAGVWTHGDLIEFDGDGQARMHGRSDAVLNVRGVRIGPAEIYESLHGVREVESAMAVQLRAEDEGAGIALLLVLREPAKLDGRLQVRIRREIARNASPAHVPEVIVAVPELPTTHSGKRSERAARDAASGAVATNASALRNPESLSAIAHAVALAQRRRRELADIDASADASTEERLGVIWESVLGVAPLQPDDNFFDVGGTSLAAVEIFALIHERMGVDLPLSALIEAPTLAELAALLDAPAGDHSRPLVTVRPGSGERPLFVVHALHGDVMFLRPLALRLATERPIYGLQAIGLDPRREPQRSVEEMAETYVENIRSAQPHGPYALAGYSFGGLVAFEMANRLAARGEAVDLLALIEPDLHHSCLPLPRRWWFLAGVPFRGVRSALAAPTRRLPRYARRLMAGALPSAVVRSPDWDSLPPVMRRLEPISWNAFRSYCPKPFPGRATLFLSDVRRPARADPLPVWRRVIEGGLELERIPGGHDDVMEESVVEILADRLSAHLERDGGEASPDCAPDQVEVRAPRSGGDWERLPSAAHRASDR
jgi:acetoacetyl-CoA synthetase